MPRKGKTGGGHKSDDYQGYTACYSREELIKMIRSGYFRDRLHLVSFLSHNMLGKPENVDKLWIRPSRLNARLPK